MATSLIRNAAVLMMDSLEEKEAKEKEREKEKVPKKDAGRAEDHISSETVPTHREKGQCQQ